MTSSLPSIIELHALCFILLLAITGFTASLQSQQVGFGYSLVSLHETDGGGLVAYLRVKQSSSTYGPDIPHLRIFIKHETKERLRIHITDAKKERWEVPYNLIPREQPPPLNIKEQSIIPYTSAEFSGDKLVFSYIPDPFSFTVKRKSDGQILFNSNYGTLVFKDQYLEISTSLPESASLYGLGETTQPAGIRLQPNDVHTLYTTDNGAYNINTNLYGSQPVYMDLRNVAGEPFAHGVLLLNSNGMDVFYTGKSLTYKVIGGVLDFYFFAGLSPLAVVDQYTSLVGRPAAMPYWALGFHQCRWGYHNLSVVEGVVEGYKKANIPLDVMWTDDDHMDSSKDFTLSSVNFPRPQMLAFLERIHSRGMKYVVIVDPGIAVNSSYGVFRRGMEKDIFIKYNGKPLLAQVWPGAVYFPDFLNPNAVSWWADEIARFHQLVPVDGLWIDMNEVSNFCSGECEIPANRKCPDPTLVKPSVCCLNCKNITSSRWDEPPYKINKFATKAPLGYKTIATSATHYNGVLEYNAHSLYGFSEAIATYKALLSPDGKQHRPFVLSRSTFVGTGAYAAHWTGDNKGTWEDLRYSITSILNFGIFGIPMVGADICGFYPQPTEELCSRWIELGAFYPFSRDHSNFKSKRQELYQWNSVAQSARNALGLRYRILPYLYTLSYQAHKTGAPIARPVFFSFPKFTASYGLSTQFMVGSSVLVSPVLKQGATTVDAVFPPGSWYNLFDMTKAIVSKDERYVTLDAPLHEINVHVYQNTVLPMQRGGMVSSEARRTPFTLIVAFPFDAIEAEAKGEVFVDNDERPEPLLVEGEASYIEFYASIRGGTVSVWSEVHMGMLCMEKGLVVEKVKVLGLQAVAEELSIEVDGQHLADTSSAYVNGSPARQQGKQENGIEKSNMVTEIVGLSVPLGKKFFLSWKMKI